MATSQQFYCPSCGHPITDAHECPAIGHIPAYIMLTCWQPGCKLVGSTTTNMSLQDDAWLRAWRVPRLFDFQTGEKLK